MLVILRIICKAVGVNEISADFSAFPRRVGGVGMSVREFFSISQASELLGFSERHLRDLCKHGIIRAKKLTPNGKWLIFAEEIERFKEGVRQKAQDELDQQQTTYWLDKAMEEHLADVRKLLEELRDRVSTSTIDSLYKAHPDGVQVAEVEKDIPLVCLEEHVPFSNLVQNCSLYADKLSKYLQACYQTIEDIRSDSDVLGLMQANQDTEEYSILYPILSCVGERQLGGRSDLLDMTNPDTGEVETFVQIVSKPGTTKLMTSESAAIRRAKFTVERILIINPHICEKITYGEAANKLVCLFSELTALETEIKRCLRDVLSRREYIWYKCRLCPTPPNR